MSYTETEAPEVSGTVEELLTETPEAAGQEDATQSSDVVPETESENGLKNLAELIATGALYPYAEDPNQAGNLSTPETGSLTSEIVPESVPVTGSILAPIKIHPLDFALVLETESIDEPYLDVTVHAVPGSEYPELLEVKGKFYNQTVEVPVTPEGQAAFDAKLAKLEAAAAKRRADARADQIGPLREEIAALRAEIEDLKARIEDHNSRSGHKI